MFCMKRANRRFSNSAGLFAQSLATDKETSRSDTLVLRRYFQVTEYRVYEHTWDGF